MHDKIEWLQRNYKIYTNDYEKKKLEKLINEREQ